LHYCRPQNRKLIEKIKIPLPNARPQLTPLFTEPELQHTIENMLRHRLAAAGINFDTVQLALDAFGEVNLAHFSQKNFSDQKPAKIKNADSEQRIPPKRKQSKHKKGGNESPVVTNLLTRLESPTTGIRTLPVKTKGGAT
jgi:hypothetical protein